MSAREEISSELSKISKTVAELPLMPVFTVPEGYFDGFPAKLLEKIRKTEELDVVSELEQISPLLASISRKTPFSVPDGYFSQLEQLLPQNEQLPAKVVTMLQPAKLRIWWAAAAVTAILGFFAWFYIINNNRIGIDGPALVNVNAELPKISETEINSYLATTPEPIQIEPLSLAGVQEADFDAIMNDITESELQQFINENPTLQIENMN
ncbi:MAG TPA: hypothetical protein VK166_13925 [Chitinophagaceae bacterium]|nr:hypothetical protein [Chitinophagaceae bacterium]